MADSAASAGDIELPVRRGDVLGDKYRVEDVLGVGGTAVVVSATHLQLEQKVAIKLLLPSAAKRDHFARLLREARVVAQMKSPHVARVVDVGALDDGRPYMVMELLEGVDLEAHLRRRGRLSLAEAADYVMQICEAVAEAHSLGVVHRDLKPGNVFITRDVDRRPLVKVLDFGLSKLSVQSTPQRATITQPLEIIGTPAYMSPEQLRATRDVDERSDIWSLGVILYELVTGELPFSDASVQELCAKVIRDTPKPLGVGLPVGIQNVIMRCLQKDPAHRFPKVSALAIALAPFAEQKQRLDRVLRVQPLTTPSETLEPEDAPLRSRAAGAPTQAAIVTDMDIDPTFGRRRGGWGLVGFGVAGALVGAAVLAGAAFVASKHPAAASTAPPEPAAVSAEPPRPPAPVDSAAPAPPSVSSSVAKAAAHATATPTATATKRTSGAGRSTPRASSPANAPAPAAPTDPEKLLETR